MEFVFAHLEYFVAAGGVIGTAVFLKFKGIKHYSNDLTPLVIKNNKQKATISERTKGVL